MIGILSKDPSNVDHQLFNNEVKYNIRRTKC